MLFGIPRRCPNQFERGPKPAPNFRGWEASSGAPRLVTASLRRCGPERAALGPRLWTVDGDSG
jgi:hypothetical protein